MFRISTWLLHAFLRVVCSSQCESRDEFADEDKRCVVAVCVVRKAEELGERVLPGAAVPGLRCSVGL